MANHAHSTAAIVSPPAPGTPPKVGHLVPWQILLATMIALVVLTVLTVMAKQVDLGPLNLWIALIIAVVKASLVCLYFMHLRYDRPFNSIVFLASVLFMALFLWLAVLDTATYRNELVPPTSKDYADQLVHLRGMPGSP